MMALAAAAGELLGASWWSLYLAVGVAVLALPVDGRLVCAGGLSAIALAGIFTVVGSRNSPNWLSTVGFGLLVAALARLSSDRLQHRIRSPIRRP